MAAWQIHGQQRYNEYNTMAFRVTSQAYVYVS